MASTKRVGKTLLYNGPAFTDGLSWLSLIQHAGVVEGSSLLPHLCGSSDEGGFVSCVHGIIVEGFSAYQVYSVYLLGWWRAHRLGSIGVLAGRGDAGNARVTIRLRASA
jgi:hypothetical protein